MEEAAAKLGYLVAGVDVRGADPELRGAAPRPEAVGDAVPQVLQLRERHRHCWRTGRGGCGREPVGGARAGRERGSEGMMVDGYARSRSASAFPFLWRPADWLSASGELAPPPHYLTSGGGGGAPAWTGGRFWPGHGPGPPVMRSR
ncbi:hypothetical protein U9M48_016821 [Paspalum notatum var. saurae]|uniref:Uncharacterized protein n=1 Tax=Paspalum notatum var. saurae TaxID=547442 RepID=A0AAQ3T6X6_PASNO